ncbi:Uma2 family endonuclease [Synechocystis sp. PCC 7509]|uniref:Uma2 family endonuclease n=1 Tax=Synechocystis sp. PCC 7509 TaxID=927677 RepID=UPI0002ACDC52|nr:Uma2 family endonuclease [Synechocystis sp. PCC 7509]
MQVATVQSYTPAEYLELEEKAEYKSEYNNGQIFPMTGGSTNHNTIALNLSTELNFAFKQQDYKVFMGDVRLWIPDKQIYTYPDVMVIAGGTQYFSNRTDTITNALIIAEVLSKSTQGYDRQAKFIDYRTIPSFQEYLLIDQTRTYVEQYVKIGEKRWELRVYNTEDEAISLSSISLQISLKDLYNKVNFELND